MSVVFCPIASGSSGNSIYIGTDNANILIDAGISGKRIEEALHGLNVNPKNLDAVFVTHEHKDHIQSVGVLSRKYDIPIYATKKTLEYMENKNMLSNIHFNNKITLDSNQKYTVGDITVSPFDVPHDALEPVGYNVWVDDYKISTLTDIGHITDNIKEKVSGSDVLLLESNYDMDMLLKGSYPYFLKQRILGDFGHLSNESAGEFLNEIICEKLKYVFLGHLSRENNKP